MLQNPAYAENRQMQQILMAHIQEHLSMKYRQEMAQMVGDPQLQQIIMSNPPQPQPGQPKPPNPPQLPPELENRIAMAAANASDKVLQLDEEKAKIMAGEKKDPQIELQEKDLALRAKKMMNDLKIHQDKMALEEAQTIIKDENADEDREIKEAQLRLNAMKDNKELELEKFDRFKDTAQMIADHKNKEEDRKQDLVEKAMDVATKTGASMVKVTGDI